MYGLTTVPHFFHLLWKCLFHDLLFLSILLYVLTFFRCFNSDSVKAQQIEACQVFQLDSVKAQQIEASGSILDWKDN